VRLLLLADLHLGARLPEGDGWSSGKEPGRNHAWSDAVGVALDKRHRIDAVLCAGDLFDHPSPNADLVAPVAEGAEALLGGGKRVVLLPGAYDGLTQPNGVYSTRAFPEGVLVVDWAEPRRVELSIGSEPLHLYTAAARPGRNGIEAAQFKRQEMEGRHVGLMHGVVGRPGPGDPPCLWGRRELPEAFFAGCDLDLFVLGGGHSYLAARHGRTLVVQPGATHKLDANGPGCHGFLVADLGAGGVQVAREGRPPVHPETSPRPCTSRSAAGGGLDPDEAVLAGLRVENSVLGHFVRRMESRCAAATGNARETEARALGLGVTAWRRMEAAHVD
jgi:predicted phosphodiesterase